MPRDPGSHVGTFVQVGGVEYALRRVIGSGGMGEVYSATGSNGHRIAVKVLTERAAADPDTLARFQREAAIAARIASPFVARVLGAGTGSGIGLWIAFELLKGEGLDVRLRREGYLPFVEVAPIIDDALEGLSAAHAVDVIHRDVKPGNLFIERPRRRTVVGGAEVVAETTKILDFGVSKVAPGTGRNSEPTLTSHDATLGSFAYMAPEQVRGSARVDTRADLYALGAVAFRALSGRLPFEGHNVLTLVALKLERDPPTLREATGEQWPTVTERFLSRMLAKDRTSRFVTAADALSAWRDVGRAMGNVPKLRIERAPRSPDDSGEQTEPADMPGDPPRR